MSDLIVLCADKMTENTIDGLLSRYAALRIRKISYDIKVHPGRDPGCFHHAHNFLRPLRLQYDHALVVFDRDWSGAPSQSAEALEDATNARLKMDWKGKAASVVISPELEVWVWSDSPHVESELGWPARLGNLRRWLEIKGLWNAGSDKPVDPKKAVEAAIREARLPWTAAVCKSPLKSALKDARMNHFRSCLQSSKIGSVNCPAFRDSSPQPGRGWKPLSRAELLQVSI